MSSANKVKENSEETYKLEAALDMVQMEREKVSGRKCVLDYFMSSVDTSLGKASAVNVLV